MITIDSQLEVLKLNRLEKLATLIVVGTMVDSLDLAVARLQNNLPHFKDLAKGSRKIHGKQKQFPEINNDIAEKVADIVEELLPWLEKVAETSRQPEDDVIGLS